MQRQSKRGEVVNDSARLNFEGSLPGEPGSTTVEVAIKGEVTISDMRRDTPMLEAGVRDGEPKFITEWGENDLVPISCPS